MARLRNSTSELQKENLNALIMGTNNSSIVSKRSVERFYYPEPHFYRYFVKKPQRRSPLIHRGYWLRMQAIEHEIRSFLKDSKSKRKQKVIVNLGCGYEPLPFSWLEREPELCRKTRFVDVDYKQLIENKCKTIRSTPVLRNIIGQFENPLESSNTVLLRSKQYIALASDLRNIERLDEAFKQEIDCTDSELLFIAEVALVYIDPPIAVDNLIAWSARLGDARFCLLEQYLPQGINHPFARTMSEHMTKHRTFLRSLDVYPQLSDQEQRFLSLGWDQVSARNLWALWGDPAVISSEQRSFLSMVEGFDEWEDFACFASHYFVLVARKCPGLDGYNCPGGIEGLEKHRDVEYICSGESISLSYTLRHENISSIQNKRRFGALFELQPGVLGHHGGFGTNSRLKSVDRYLLGGMISSPCDQPHPPFQARMCHTATNLDAETCLFVGGRLSPDLALSECWLHHEGLWERIDDLPVPLYRHCSTLVQTTQGRGVLVYGGKTTRGALSNDWFFWQEVAGWTKLSSIPGDLKPRFGATISNYELSKGILLGGMSDDCIILQEIWQWEIDTKLKTTISLTSLTRPSLELICRFGASVSRTSAGLFLIGGVLSGRLWPHRYDILVLNLSFVNDKLKDIQPKAVEVKIEGTRPVLVGHASYANTSRDDVAIAGGGLVCFSFGALWNEGIWTLSGNNKAPGPKIVPYDSIKQSTAISKDPNQKALVIRKTLADHACQQPRNLVIPRMKVATAKDFQRIVNKSQPVVMEGLNIGRCTEKWSLEYLKDKIGGARPVTVHELKAANDKIDTSERLDFRAKNFKYVTKSFGEFIDQISQGSKQYLRSLAAHNPAERPTELAMDFPEIAADFQLPNQFEMIREKAHSSPLRISGPVMMWLHYDVMANVLCQVRSNKRLLLYPPSDVVLLGFEAGSSSSSVNVFENGHDMSPLLSNTHPHEAVLRSGDVLFIPPLWLHAASPTETSSVAVNIFFRSLDLGYAAGRDVYGNRDLQAYEKGRKDIEKIAKNFDGLTPEFAQFYLLRLAEELKEKAK